MIFALVLAGLTARSPPTEGAVGVKLDAEGRLVGVFDWCRGKTGAESIRLVLDMESSGVEEKVIELKREPGRRARTAEEVVLLDPGPGWRTELATAALDDDVAYALRAWNRKEGIVAAFPFQISELRSHAGSDLILTKEWDNGASGYVGTFRTADDFARYAETVCD
ncbi:hypothetical protein O7606_18615 [Micromonospora sp. WMMD882]|uniref:hypothetical protein n=1 Tax=Micromonospora sp. WMMD882 TaxID=3015151 RepID=UPI00248B47AC|nr:hypothetical protein [Micromonospora sp. WMMD882]WBB78241.1 hypothetical protein O7606_18615 [Micromonospora sp. WMMD882]